MQLTKEQRIFFVRSFDTINNVTGVVFSRVTVRKTTATTEVSVELLSEKQQQNFARMEQYYINRNKGNSGRLVTKRIIPENIQLVHQQIEEHEGVSTRRNELDLSRSTIQRIIKERLKLLSLQTKSSPGVTRGRLLSKSNFLWMASG